MAPSASAHSFVTPAKDRGNAKSSAMFSFRSVLHRDNLLKRGQERSRVMTIDTPLLLAVAAILTALANVIWSMRRKP